MMNQLLSLLDKYDWLVQIGAALLTPAVILAALIFVLAARRMAMHGGNAHDLRKSFLPQQNANGAMRFSDCRGFVLVVVFPNRQWRRLALLPMPRSVGLSFRCRFFAFFQCRR